MCVYVGHPRRRNIQDIPWRMNTRYREKEVGEKWRVFIAERTSVRNLERLLNFGLVLAWLLKHHLRFWFGRCGWGLGIYIVNEIVWIPGWSVNSDFKVVFIPGVPHFGRVVLRPRLEVLNHFGRGQEKNLIRYERRQPPRELRALGGFGWRLS